MSEDQSQAVNQGHTLTIQRRLDASIERVFSLLTEPIMMQQWFGPADSVVEQCSFAPVVGSAWFVRLKLGSGELREVHGSVLSVVPPHAIRFTWQWRDVNTGEDGLQTLVSIQLQRDANETLLLLRQAEFTNQADCKQHDLGWTSSLDRIPI